MKLRILPAALDDLEAGRAFYDSIEAGVGNYFTDSISADIVALVSRAGIHSVRDGHYFLPCRRFPFAIYYRIVQDDVLVDAILDCRRSPEWIRKRLTR